MRNLAISGLIILLSLSACTKKEKGFKFLEKIDTLLQYPFQIVTDKIINDKINTIEVEVTNLAVNRGAGLELQGIDWQNFLFGRCLFRWTEKDESWEPPPTGLLGPVIISPSLSFQPKPKP